MNVTKYFMTDFGRHYVFRNVTLDLPLDKNVGIIGPNGAGKSTFLRLIGGADTPSSGRILKSGRISPPMGLTPGLQGSLTAAENARFAGRIYGMQRSEIDAMINYVREIADIGPYFDMPVATYSAGMRQRVAFAVNMSMKFDYYLFDEISAGGDRAFRKTAKAMIAERLRTSRFILSSHDIDEILEICHSGIVIKDGQLTFFDDVRDAATFYGEDSATSSGNGKSDEKKKAKRAKKRQKKRRARRAKKETAPKSREASPRPSKEAKDEAGSTKRTKSLTSTALARKRLKLDESTASAGPRPQNSNRSLRHNRA